MKIHEQYMGTDKFIFVGEQRGATGSHVTGSDGNGSHVTGNRMTERGPARNRRYIMRMRNRKFHNTLSGAFPLEVTSVIVCACATDTFCITTKVIVQVHGYLWPKFTRKGGRAHAQPEVAQYHRKLATVSDVIFPRIFLLVVQNVGWGVLYDVSVYPFPWLSAPFIFIIIYSLLFSDNFVV